MGFSRIWSGLPFPSPGNLPNPGIEPWSPSLQVESFTIWIKKLLQELSLNVFAQKKSIHSCWGSRGVLKTNTTSFHQSLPQCNRVTGWKWKLLSRVRLFCDPRDYTVHGVLQARILEWVAVPSSRFLPNPEIEPRSLALQADSLPAEPPGKPKNTGVGSLSLLQQIFLMQGERPWPKRLTSLYPRALLLIKTHSAKPQAELWVVLLTSE